MLTPREKSPLPEKVPRGGSNPRRCGQRAQTLPTSYSGPLIRGSKVVTSTAVLRAPLARPSYPIVFLATPPHSLPTGIIIIPILGPTGNRRTRRAPRKRFNIGVKLRTGSQACISRQQSPLHRLNLAVTPNNGPKTNPALSEAQLG